MLPDEMCACERVCVCGHCCSFLLDPKVRKVRFGLSWDASCDVDTSLVMFDKDLHVVDKVGPEECRAMTSTSGIEHSVRCLLGQRTSIGGGGWATAGRHSESCMSSIEHLTRLI